MKRSYVFAGITVLFWSTLSTVAKITMENIPSLQTLSVGGFLAFGFLLAVNLATGRLKKAADYAPEDYLKMAGLGFLGLFLYSALYYYGLSQLSAQTACIVNYLWPIMLVLFSCLLLHEKMTPLKMTALLISFAGIVVLSLAGPGQDGGNFAGGVLACLAAAACYGLFSVLNKMAAYDQNICMMVFWLIVGICALLAGKAAGQWSAIPAASWPGLIWMGFAVNAAAYLFWALAVNGESQTAGISNIAYLTPVLSVVLSGIVLHEKISGGTLAAFLLIIGGIFFQALDQAREKKYNKEGEAYGRDK